MSSPRTLILGTAGHVDHGKTSLVRALTGKDTDRLEEEHRRGISIELGFAHLDLGDSLRLGIVDVPGHERFVRQMVAGAGGMDLALLLVAADEGVMPQTVEHFDVLRLLGVRDGLVVITKIDLVDPELVEVVQAEVAELVAGSFLEKAPRIPVSSTTGEGLDRLENALRELALGARVRPRSGDFRLPLDRVFSLSGAGVVVTGTAWSGEVAQGDHLRLLPHDRKVRVREVQSHDESVPVAGAGERVALALHGIKKDELERGDVLVSGPSWRPSLRVGVELTAVRSLNAPLRQRIRVHVHHAAREVLGRIDLLEGNELAAGHRMLARLHLEDVLVPAPGDRLVVRSYSPMLTIAGAVVLDPFSPARQRRAEALTRLRKLQEGGRCAWAFLRVAESGCVGRERREVTSDFEMMGYSGEEAARKVDAAIEEGRWWSLADRVVDAQDGRAEGRRALHLLREHQRRHPLSPGMPKEELRGAMGFAGSSTQFSQLLARWSRDLPLFPVADRVRADEAEVPIDAATRKQLEDLLARVEAAEVMYEASEDELRSPQMALLLQQGRVVRLQGRLIVSRRRLEEWTRRVAEHFQHHPRLEVAQVKEWTRGSRKFVVPLLEWFDLQDITRFDGHSRSRGPSCPGS